MASLPVARSLPEGVETPPRYAFNRQVVRLSGTALLLIGEMAYVRGTPHYRGDEIGSHGTKVVVVHIVP